MARSKRWTQGEFVKGSMEIKLSGWNWLSDFVNQRLLDYTTYIYRGHGNSSWSLEPSLDRIIKSSTSAKREEHLQHFRYSARGRRGSNPPTIDSENDWWALGQHHGLATPLLDWTESPFVALYFAMINAKVESGSSVCIWALAQGAVELYSEEVTSDASVPNIDNRKPIVELVRPLTDDNSRLVNQRGLFTRGPNNIPLENWIHTYHEMYRPKATRRNLLKITIPKTGIDDCLRYLNRMNINHATLFPDLYGASKFCNINLNVKNY